MDLNATKPNLGLFAPVSQSQSTNASHGEGHEPVKAESHGSSESCSGLVDKPQTPGMEEQRVKEAGPEGPGCSLRADHLSHPCSLTPGPAPTLTPCEEPAHSPPTPHLGSEQGKLLLGLAPPTPPSLQRGPSRASPEFLPLKRPRTLVSSRGTEEGAVG